MQEANRRSSTLSRQSGLRTRDYLLAFVPLAAAIGLYSLVGPNPPVLGFNLLDWTSVIGVYGVYVTVAGFAVALLQIRKVQDAASAAADAASEARDDVIARLSIGEYGRAAPLCANAADAIRAGKVELAEVRLSLLRITVSSAKKAADIFADTALSAELQDLVARVAILEQAMSRRISGSRVAPTDDTEAIDELKQLEFIFERIYSDQRYGFLVRSERTDADSS